MDIVHDNSPSSYLKNGAGQLYHAWGKIHGTRVDYQPYFVHTRGLCLELHNVKFLPESQLKQHWDYNQDAMLDCITQTLYGIKGIVTDSTSNKPIFAKVTIENHDIDSSHIYSDMPFGDYYRPLYKGTYDVTFSAPEYYSKTIKSVTVENEKAIVLNVKLLSKNTAIEVQQKELAKSISVQRSGKNIVVLADQKLLPGIVSIYSLSGKLIYEKSISKNRTFIKSKNIFPSGNYIVQLQKKKTTFRHKVFINN